AYLFSTGINVFDSDFNLKNILPTLPIKNYYNNGSGIDKNITKDGTGRYWTAGWIVQVLLPGEKKFEAANKLFPQLKWLANSGEFDDVVSTCDGNILLKKNKSLFFHINKYSLATDTIRYTATTENGVSIYSMQTFYDPVRNELYLVGKNGIEQYNLVSKKMRSIAISTLSGNTDSMGTTIYPELDASGRIWSYIPQYGFRIINPETLLCIDSIQFEEKGLVKRTYDQIKSGPENYMYLHAQNGVVIYNYKTQHSFLFDNTNGLSSPEDISLLSANGNMILGQRGGFDFFKTSNLDQYTSHVTPWLNTVIADSIIFARIGAENKAQVQLSYLQNTITFSFSALEYFFPERIEYEYQLWPVDLKFSKTDFFNRKITYSKLQPGKYIFKLKAQMEGGNWNDPAIEFPFEIVPAFWQTTWFKLLCFLLVGSILFFFVRWRIHFIRSKQNLQLIHEKELLDLEAKALRAQMNPHFIFNSLNSIKSLINKNENETAANYLAVFSKLIRTLFQNSDKREVSLYEEIETCKLYTQIEKMRFGEKVDFQFDVDEHIDLKDVRVPALILQPFIENAIWHGMVHKEYGGMVHISIEEVNGAINCIIDDNGIGRDISKKFKASYETTYESKGIGLTKARLHLDKLLNDREDKITIIDKKDAAGRPEGTKVIITFKQN
ncbi:MAG: histidine kinase, partial [Bacteroidota bacterium]